MLLRVQPYGCTEKVASEETSLSGADSGPPATCWRVKPSDFREYRDFDTSALF